MRRYSGKQLIMQLVGASFALGALGLTNHTLASDCMARINELDQRLSYSGLLIGDENSTKVSGFLHKARSLRESALILLSQQKPDECETLATQAIKMARKSSNPSIFSAESLIGRTLTNEDGEELGEIENIMVDLDHGVVAYALVSFGGVLGVGEELVPLPFDKVSINPENDSLEVNVSRSILESAPRYLDEDQDLLSRRKWATALHLHYDQHPYWVSAKKSTEPQPKATQAQLELNVSESKPEEMNEGNSSSVHSEQASSISSLFTILDTDNNDKITREESRREFVIFKRFNELDQSQDNSLTEEEFMVVAQSNSLSEDGEALIPRAKDALPEEAWTGGKVETEASAAD